MSIQTADDVLYTTKEAAKELKLTQATVFQYISRGLIKPRKEAGRNFIPKSECDRFKQERRGPGNPNFVKKSRRKNTRRATKR